MTHDPLNSRPPVEIAPRTRMTPARKRRLHGLAQGLCGCGCGEDVPLSGPGVIYDHFQMLEEGGLDDWPNLRPVKTAHDKPKTSADLRKLGKIRRQAKLTKAKVESKRPIKTGRKLPTGAKLHSRGFQTTGPKQKIPSRRMRSANPAPVRDR